MTYLDGFNEAKEAAANWLRRQANTEMDNSKRMAFIEAHNATLALQPPRDPRSVVQPPEIELVQKMHKLEGENTRLRAAIAQGTAACIYCSLPADEWAKCRSGFPGCARADDAMGCPEFGARMACSELEAEVARLKGVVNKATEDISLAIEYGQRASTALREARAENERWRKVLLEISSWSTDENAPFRNIVDAGEVAREALKSERQHHVSDPGWQNLMDRIIATKDQRILELETALREARELLTEIAAENERLRNALTKIKNMRRIGEASDVAIACLSTVMKKTT